MSAPSGIWHRWFAWHPVKLMTGEWVWLQTVLWSWLPSGVNADVSDPVWYRAYDVALDGRSAIGKARFV